MVAEQRFYSALRDMFIGEKLEGKSGYVNLMNIKYKYFSQIKPYIQEQIEKRIENQAARNELFDKLFTFFESYFNETGTPFFYKTQIHKNIYEKVYSDREDTSLFWKTQKLFYVKSEANYKSVENMSIEGKDGFVRYFNFDASEIEHQKNNEKKMLSFHLTKVSDDKETYYFKVRYAKNSDYSRIKKYLEIDDNDKVKKYIFENFSKIKNAQIDRRENFLDISCLSYKDDIYIRNNTDSIESVLIEISIGKIENILKYFQKKDIVCSEDILKKAFSVYKRQNEIDYFIHKNARSFLKEQFDLYVYHYIFGEKNIASDLTVERIKEIKTIKEIAYLIIEYIAKFEDELKSIWEKPKFARKTNYVLTLNKLAHNPLLIKKIISHKGFEEQIAEWKKLSEKWLDENGVEIKKQWIEFREAACVDKKDILENDKLNVKYSFLPVDTKYFEDLKADILESFSNLKDALDGEMIKSDNWQALNTLADKYNGKIQTIYIDPPFNTGKDFDFKDGYQDSTWLTLMDNRLELSKKYLTSNGSFFLHLDGNANYYGRILMNNNFTKANFINEIIWSYRTGGASTKTSLPKKHDNIYLYANNADKFKIHPIYERQYYEKAFMNPKQDEEGRYYADTLLRDVLEGNFDEAKDDKVVSSYSVKPVLNTSLEHLGFDNQKPEGLLDILMDFVEAQGYVMDFFSGSASTIATAHKKGLKWIGVDMGEHFYRVMLPRMKKVLMGDRQGISSKCKWAGGGFFKYYELEQYEEALTKCIYTDKNITLDNFENYTFNPDNEKFLSALEMNIQNKEVKVNLEKLYSDIDLAGTLENITGKFIKQQFKDRIVFEDNTEIDLNNKNWDNLKLLKPLLWWKN